MFVMDYYSMSGDTYKLHMCDCGYYAFDKHGNCINDDYFNTLAELEKYCDSYNRPFTFQELAEKVNAVGSIKALNDNELHWACNRINDFYDSFEFDYYELWIDSLTTTVQEYNWLEDLCTDLRALGSWDRC